MKALVFATELKTLPSLLTAASQVDSDEIFAVVLGGLRENLEDLGRFGAKKVFLAENIPKELETTFGLSAIVEQLAKENGADVILTNSMPFENEILAYTAAKMGAPATVEVVGLEKREGELVVLRSSYGGKLIAEIKMKGTPLILSIAPGAFEEKEVSENKAEVVTISPSITEEGVKLIEKSEVVVKGKPLEDADIVIGVGRGIKKKEDLSMIYELAELLDAAVGCTRPLSADYGWFEEWIGVSGKRISPKLYLVIGASGSVQHMAGVRGSKLIISINKDGEAPVFEESDYLFVADLYKLVPTIIEELKKLK